MNRCCQNISLLILLFVFFSSCSKSDEIINDSVDQGSTQSLSAKINGEDFSVSGVLVTAQYSTVSETIYSLAIGGAELPLNGVARAIALAIISADSTKINQGETYSANSISRIAGGQYSFDNGTTEIKAITENTDIATITITKIDYDKKLVSGVFSFDGIDEDDPATIYQVRDGVFTDVAFE